MSRPKQQLRLALLVRRSVRKRHAVFRLPLVSLSEAPASWKSRNQPVLAILQIHFDTHGKRQRLHFQGWQLGRVCSPLREAVLRLANQRNFEASQRLSKLVSSAGILQLKWKSCRDFVKKLVFLTATMQVFVGFILTMVLQFAEALQK